MTVLLVNFCHNPYKSFALSSVTPEALIVNEKQ